MPDIIKIILKTPIIPVYFTPDLRLATKVMASSFEAGIDAFEFTNRGSEAMEIFKEISKIAKADYPDKKLGIGTILNQEEAKKFIDAGADFVVQPGISPEVADACEKQNIPWIPGVITPSEILNALNLGAEMVKLFPANVMGSAYIKALRGPMPNLKIMATGGIEPTEASLKEWFGAGVNAVGMGSQLFKNLDNVEEFKTKVKELLSFIQP
jgi:2-dehydro-3-deoxyphosphogluconate aldolase / (4S)-4-hydroxy-2-oxoglutarate aldolase